MKTNHLLSVVSALIVAVTGCGASEMASAAPIAAPPASDVSNAGATMAMSEAKMETATTPTQPTPQAVATHSSAAKTATPESKAPDAQAANFLIMYTGDIALSVDDGKVASSIDRIVDVAESVGGHLAGRRDQSVTVRVPSARFREALGKLGDIGEVTHEAVTAEDVSEEFHDAEVRLSNLKATRTRLQEFLSKTANMNDMLTLERELERVSMDIDRVEGRMRFLREHTAFSTLTVALMARPKSQPIVTGGGVKPTTTAPRVMQLHAEWLDELGVNKLVAN